MLFRSVEEARKALDNWETEQKRELNAVKVRLAKIKLDRDALEL